MSRMRLGYACTNTYLRERGVFTSRTIRLSTLKKNSMNYIYSLVDANLDDLSAIIEWNYRHNIEVFRLSSEIFPHITNQLLDTLIDFKTDYPYDKIEEDQADLPRPEDVPDDVARTRAQKRRDRIDKVNRAAHVDDGETPAYDIAKFAQKLRTIGAKAREYGMRLSEHALPYVVLGSMDSRVVAKSRADLIHLANIFDIMEMSLDSVIIVHIGATFGDKRGTLLRWMNAFNALPERVKMRIALENDDFYYSPDEILPICEELKIPMCLDLFHWQLNPGAIQPDELFVRTFATWENCIGGKRRPKFHISEQAGESFADRKHKNKNNKNKNKNTNTNKKIGAHSDYVSCIPKFLFEIAEIIPFDIMVEAKMKEQAVLYLYKKYHNKFELNLKN
ncbi:MAG TPA: UV DNA damage repair endonuclease UvsE [Candidatus Paceibacterota bacterium]